MKYDWKTLKEWGSDFRKETDQELLLLLNTNVGSVAFNRNLGILDSENIPMSKEFGVLYGIQIIESIEDHNLTSRPERQIVTDLDLIQEIDFDEKENTIENEIGYYRLIDFITEDNA